MYMKANLVWVAIIRSLLLYYYSFFMSILELLYTKDAVLNILYKITKI